MGLNAYVASLLSRREVTAPVESAIEGRGYRVTRATVEKVLVGRAPGASSSRPARLPFDTMVWFHLERVPAP
jgi:hypothetical protein